MKMNLVPLWSAFSGLPIVLRGAGDGKQAVRRKDKTARIAARRCISIYAVLRNQPASVTARCAITLTRLAR
jgi:hypothetical protein